MHFSQDGSSFLQILPLKVGNLHFPHIKVHNDKAETYFVTNGEFVVTSILLWDEDNSIVYFIGESYEIFVRKRTLVKYQFQSEVLIKVMMMMLSVTILKNPLNVENLTTGGPRIVSFLGPRK